MTNYKKRGDNDMKIYEYFMWAVSTVAALLAGMVGGCDSMFAFLLVLVLTDIATGFIAAWYNKEINSKVLRRGLINKTFYIIFIWLGVLADNVVMDTTGNYITISNHVILIRNVIVAYLMLEELVSVLENAAKMGLPVPSWLRSVLQQVSDVANSSTPKVITKWLHDKLGLSIDHNKDKDKDKDKDKE